MRCLVLYDCALYGTIWCVIWYCSIQLLVRYLTMHFTDPSYSTVHHTVPYHDVSYGTVWCIIRYCLMHHTVPYDASYGTVWCVLWDCTMMCCVVPYDESYGHHMMSHMDTILCVVWYHMMCHMLWYNTLYSSVWLIIWYHMMPCTQQYSALHLRTGSYILTRCRRMMAGWHLVGRMWAWWESWYGIILENNRNP